MCIGMYLITNSIFENNLKYENDNNRFNNFVNKKNEIHIVIGYANTIMVKE